MSLTYGADSSSGILFAKVSLLIIFTIIECLDLFEKSFTFNFMLFFGTELIFRCELSV